MWNDKETWIRIVLFGVFIGVVIIRLLYKSFAKPLQGQPPQPQAGGPGPGGGPSREGAGGLQDLKKFLEQIRREAVESAAGRRPEPAAEREEALEQEPELQPEPEREPLVRVEAPPPLAQRSILTYSQDSATPAQVVRPAQEPGARPESVHEYIERLSQGTSATSDPRSARVPTRGGIPALGLSPRDGMLAEVIFSPPPSCRRSITARRPGSPRSPRTAGGRPRRRPS